MYPFPSSISFFFSLFFVFLFFFPFPCNDQTREWNTAVSTTSRPRPPIYTNTSPDSLHIRRILALGNVIGNRLPFDGRNHNKWTCLNISQADKNKKLRTEALLLYRNSRSKYKQNWPCFQENKGGVHVKVRERALCVCTHRRAGVVLSSCSYFSPNMTSHLRGTCAGVYYFTEIAAVPQNKVANFSFFFLGSETHFARKENTGTRSPI